jgi:hypothetical protein
MRTAAICLLLLAPLFATSCASSRDAGRDADLRALLALHEDVLQAHRDSDVERLLAGAIDPFVMANRGAITHPTVDERRARLGAYLARTRFTLYRDQVPPVARVSADGSMGWVIAQVEARGEQRSDDGTTVPLEFVSAWIELYEKRDGRWVAVGNLSNFKPQE